MYSIDKINGYSVYTYSSYVAKNIRVKGKVVFRNVQMALK